MDSETIEGAQPHERSAPNTRLGLEFPADPDDVGIRGQRIVRSLQYARRVVGPRNLRVVVRTELATEIEELCTVSDDGRGLLDMWELVASPDAAADQMTLFDLTGLWVYSAFVPPAELSEEAGRVYEGLRRAGYAIPKALELAVSLGQHLEVPTMHQVAEQAQPAAQVAGTLYNPDGGDVSFLDGQD